MVSVDDGLEQRAGGAFERVHAPLVGDDVGGGGGVGTLVDPDEVATVELPFALEFVVVPDEVFVVDGQGGVAVAAGEAGGPVDFVPEGAFHQAFDFADGGVGDDCGDGGGGVLVGLGFDLVESVEVFGEIGFLRCSVSVAIGLKSGDAFGSS